MFNGAGTQTNRYLHGPGIDQILADERTPTSTYWALTDHQGSVRDILGNSGVLRNRISYDSFGNVVSQTNATVTSRFGYTGRELDPESGLMFYRARYYDPRLGRFISEDPLGFGAGDANLYRYVFNSPTNFTDPTGMVSSLNQLARNPALARELARGAFARNPGNLVMAAAGAATGIALSIPQVREACVNALSPSRQNRPGPAPFLEPGDPSLAPPTTGPFGGTPPFGDIPLDVFPDAGGWNPTFPGDPSPPRQVPGFSLGDGDGLAPPFFESGGNLGGSNKPPFPAPISNPRYTWPGHQSAATAEEQLARRIHNLPDEVVVRWGNRIGVHGSDVISVNAQTGGATLWDAKFRGAATRIQGSPTFSVPSRRANAIDEAIETLQTNTSLPPAIRQQAIRNLQSGNFNTRTVGFGNARNSVLE